MNDESNNLCVGSRDLSLEWKLTEDCYKVIKVDVDEWI